MMSLLYRSVKRQPVAQVYSRVVLPVLGTLFSSDAFPHPCARGKCSPAGVSPHRRFPLQPFSPISRIADGNVRRLLGPARTRTAPSPGPPPDSARFVLLGRVSLALCSPRTRFPTPAREESVRLRAFHRIGGFRCNHSRPFLGLLMGMFADFLGPRGPEQRHHPDPRPIRRPRGRIGRQKSALLGGAVPPWRTHHPPKSGD